MLNELDKEEKCIEIRVCTNYFNTRHIYENLCNVAEKNVFIIYIN